MQQAQVKSVSPEHLHILHLSDLHFEKLENGASEQSLPYLEGRLEDYFEKVGNVSRLFDLIVVTGDLADNNAKIKADTIHIEVLEQAKSYLEELAKKWCINGVEGLSIIPGNHDYRWCGNIGSRNAERAFKRMYSRYFQHKAYSFSHNGNATMRLILACLDSNNDLGNLDFAMGKVCIQEMIDLQRKLNSLPPEFKNALKIALVHHHPLPVAEADNFELRTIWDKVFRKPVVGGPEFMLLKNSGSFLHKLLAANFRLVLHGHLHKRGYWRAITRLHSGEDRWVEVISGSSAGKPEEGDDFSVNAVKVHKDGYIDATHLGWSSAGNWRTPLPIPCTPYDVIRVEEASLPPDADARSLKYTQTWELSLKNGDIKTVEMHRGLRSATRTPLKELKVQTTASAMTAGTLKVEVSEGPQIKDFEIKPNLEDPDGPTFDYFMQFERPLTENDSASIDYKYTYRGVMFRSREDQENFGTKPEEAGHDEVIQEIVRPTEQFLFILRFVSDEGGEKVWYPEKLHLQVLDADGVPCSREERSSHVLFDYTKPDSDALTKSVLVQAILCIHKPRIGFSYKISWKLPENDNMPHESETRVYRRNLLGLSAKPALRARADAFVTECLIKLNELISQEYPLSQQDDSLHSYLFAFGEKSRDLQCRGTTAALNEHLVVTSFEYGFDIIGTAFRRREMMRYPYKTSFGKEMLRKIDEAKVKYLLVFPLNFPNDNGWPVGMLAFASGAGDSPLKEVFLNDSLLARLKLEISEIWKSNVDKLCRYPATA